MIKCIISKDTIKISGHANYDVYGKDIVCASVSSIVTTTVNIIMNIDNKAISYQDDGKVITITKLNDNKIVCTIIETMISMLKDLENQYNKNIKIESEE